jgi:hypothetical protein
MSVIFPCTRSSALVASRAGTQCDTCTRQWALSWSHPAYYQRARHVERVCECVYGSAECGDLSARRLVALIEHAAYLPLVTVGEGLAAVPRARGGACVRQLERREVLRGAPATQASLSHKKPKSKIKKKTKKKVNNSYE